MSFTSLSFLIFWVALGAFYYLLPGKCQKYLLLLASLLFYTLFSLKMLFLALFGVALAFVLGLGISKIRSKSLKKAKILLFLAIVLELSMLIGLKYLAPVREGLRLLLPIGISFYTLALLGYVIDVYRGKYEAESNPLDFLLFALYFPHILQGPIARYDQLSPKLKEKHDFSYEKVTFGIQLALWGYIKKLVIADRLGLFVDSCFANIEESSGLMLLFAILLYTLQIYMDFSGCVDIALGVSESLGIPLMQNFREPYLANSIGDFWRRWHISLSSWFRDYVYIPLGGNRKGKLRRWINVLIVFAISGIWHGVGINYFIWGMLHGLYQVIGAGLMPLRKGFTNLLGINRDGKAFRNIQRIPTLLLVSFAWIFFRVTDLGEALLVCSKLLPIGGWQAYRRMDFLSCGISFAEWVLVIVFLFLAFAVDLLHEKGFHIRESIASLALPLRWMIYLLAFYSIVLFGIYGFGYDASAFIYMNF